MEKIRVKNGGVSHQIGETITQDYHEMLMKTRKAAIPIKKYRQAISAKCKECWPYRSSCRGVECALYKIEGTGYKGKHRKGDLRKAIAAECTECCGTRVDVCQSPRCPLYELRFGKTEKQRQNSQ